MARLHSFSVGLEGSPDLAAAASAAKHIGTIHHPYTFTLQEGLDAVAEVIHHLETYDVTTVRAATPMRGPASDASTGRPAAAFRP